jgi:hypothetical protein
MGIFVPKSFSTFPVSPIEYMRSHDPSVFQQAAAYFNAWIVVRKSNIESKQYIGEEGYTPKRIDCKAKTATSGAFVSSYQGKAIGLHNRHKDLSGLVTNPTITGYGLAFKHYVSALQCWGKFSTHLPSASQPQTGNKLAPGFEYTWVTDPEHVRFGCVQFCPGGNTRQAQYIHSDYDLYAIASAQHPDLNIRVQDGKLYNVDHTHSTFFKDVQEFVNRRLGVAMIQHGEQDTFAEDRNDTLDVFPPSGDVARRCTGMADVDKLYNEVFRGRKMFTSGERRDGKESDAYHVAIENASDRG